MKFGYDKNDSSDAAIRDAVHTAGGNFNGKYDDDKPSKPSKSSSSSSDRSPKKDDRDVMTQYQ